MKRSLITRIPGQDGSCLAELLLERGYEVISTNINGTHFILSDLKSVRPGAAAASAA